MESFSFSIQTSPRSLENVMIMKLTNFKLQKSIIYNEKGPENGYSKVFLETLVKTIAIKNARTLD